MVFMLGHRPEASWLGPDYISIIDYCYDAGPRLPVKNLYF